MSDLTIWTYDWVPEGYGFQRSELSGDRPATDAYVARATERPAFKKARVDQIALFEAAAASLPLRRILIL